MPTDLPYAAEAETSLGPEELKVNDNLIRTSCLLVKTTVGKRPRSGGHWVWKGVRRRSVPDGQVATSGQVRMLGAEPVAAARTEGGKERCAGDESRNVQC